MDFFGLRSNRVVISTASASLIHERQSLLHMPATIIGLGAVDTRAFDACVNEEPATVFEISNVCNNTANFPFHLVYYVGEVIVSLKFSKFAVITEAPEPMGVLTSSLCLQFEQRFR
ncbi:hypothetical protein MPER_04722 [Moniliophthora perniciosa FA553]|nr:hypothetical protein MPER_04722 [Moniliophthora perniciosa FA553]